MTPSDIEFFSVDDYARQQLEAQLSDVPWLAEVPPFTVAGLLDPETELPLSITTAEEMLQAEERAANSVGLYGKVLEPWGGSINGRAIDAGVSVVIVENPEVNRDGANGIGIPGKVMVRHVIATLLRRPGGAERGSEMQGFPEFRLADDTFARIESDAGLLSYVVNFQIRVLLR